MTQVNRMQKEPACYIETLMSITYFQAVQYKVSAVLQEHNIEKWREQQVSSLLFKKSPMLTSTLMGMYQLIPESHSESGFLHSIRCKETANDTLHNGNEEV